MSDISNRKHLDALKYGAAILAIFLTGLILLSTGVFKYPELLGMAVLSYSFGLRHAFDADHIAAIDNMTRKLIQEQKKTKGVGFFFSCGHSTVVIIMGLLTIFAVKWAQAALPQFQAVGGVIATLVSGVFLILLAAINFVILKDILKTFSSMRNGTYTPESAERPDKGVVNRTINRLFDMVANNRHVYLVGFLFGLGFDTATQIAVLATSASASAAGIPWVAILAFPILFTAGMSMMDTLDGFFMSTAYQWVFSSPLRKVYYNLTITGLSILAAGVIGIIEVGQVFAQESGRDSGFWLWLQHLDFNVMGFILVGMFVVVWAISFAGWKLLRLSEKENSLA
ncbi:High-affinity nickel-transport protein [Acididesulfobacillus acetoxydans]|uniref:Nickel/cobalt efflux system n=1 Tax=Acididesulfobacillus acetoxydans TaxID=1561005 RepID=A0A8S0WM50_9FIRM|nr:HoxN/HupN/NixA family nickel/cobalt transporter [Acididesulfobacillus acetoxydans]CAA7600384.1 High-affinity nickel-transport protein [Acididesulfobacillus acetoxydans]CEJ07906.1 High-affinity nickel-transport protein NixA [Acididesulfobacillus acetoxydans]